MCKKRVYDTKTAHGNQAQISRKMRFSDCDAIFELHRRPWNGSPVHVCVPIAECYSALSYRNDGTGEYPGFEDICSSGQGNQLDVKIAILDNGPDIRISIAEQLFFAVERKLCVAALGNAEAQNDYM